MARPSDSAVWMRARAELRHGRGSAALMAILVAISAAAVLVGAAAARRTDSAYDRAVAETEAWDVFVNPEEGSESALRVDDVLDLPQVADAATLEAMLIGTRRIEDQSDLDEGYAGIVGLGGTFERFARPILVSGRLAAPDRPDEVTISPGLAASQHVGPGDVLRTKLIRPDELNRLEDAGNPDELVAMYNDAGFGAAMDLRVTGVVRFPDEVVVDEGYEPEWTYVSPGLWDEFDHPSAGFGGIVVRLRPDADRDEFRTSLEALVPDESLILQTEATSRTKVMRSVRPTVVAILVFAILALVMGLLVVAQAFSRRFRARSVDNPTLDAVGMTRRQRTLASVLWAAAPIGVGALAAGAMTALASPIAPIGVARRAEPNAAIHIDWPVLSIGVLATLVVTLVVVALPAWLAAGTTSVTGRPVPSRAARSMMAAGAPVPVVLGTKFALETQRGRAETPTRTVLVGATTGVALVVALLAFGASLQRFTTTPRLYGTPWNVQIEGSAPTPEAGAEVLQQTRSLLERSSDVREWSELSASSVVLDGTATPAVAFDDGERPVEVPVIDGRRPARPDEIALASSTMRRLGLALDDTTTAIDPNGTAHEMRVVGRVVLPSVGSYQGSDKTSIGEGALLTGDGLRRIAPEVGSSTLVALLVDGADVATIQAQLPSTDDGGYAYAAPVVRPAEIETLQALRSTPLALVGLVIALVAATVAHAIVVAVRFRRHDLAVLRACGFVRKQVVAATVVQALTSGLAAIALGVPIGLLVGIASWNALAGQLGTLSEPVVPIGTVAIACAGVLVATSLVGLLPGLWAANRNAATALRVA